MRRVPAKTVPAALARFGSVALWRAPPTVARGHRRLSGRSPIRWLYLGLIESGYSSPLFPTERSNSYECVRQDLIVAAITSNVRRRLFGDYVVAEWASAGLLLPSVVTGILRTIQQTMVERRLGRMADTELQSFLRLLRRALAL